MQNLDSVNTANISAQFIDTSGTTVSTVTKSIGPGLSTVIDQRAAGGGLDCCSTFNGSAVLSSNTQIASVVEEFSANNATTLTNFRSGGYNGLDSTSASQTMMLPQVLKNIVDPSLPGITYNTTIAIQNTDLSASAAVTVTYYGFAGYGAGPYVNNTYTIPPGSSNFINLTTEPAVTPSVWYGSAVVTSSTPVAVVVNQNAGGGLMAYTGFAPSEASTKLYAPLMMKNVYDAYTNLNWFTAAFVMVANQADSGANVYVTYTPSGGGTPVTVIKTASPGVSFDTRAVLSQSMFYGSAVITSSVPIVGIVSELTLVDATRGSRADIYRAFPNNAGSSTLFVPTLLKNVYDDASGVNWYTGLALQWQGTVSTTLTITYTQSSGTTYVGTTQLGPYVPFVMLDQSNISTLAGVGMFYGSAVVTSNPPEPFVGNVNQLGNSAAYGDAFLSFKGINR